MRRAVDILRERNDELAALETLDTGKAKAAMPNTARAMIFNGARKRPTVSSRRPGYREMKNTNRKYTLLEDGQAIRRDPGRQA